MSGALIEQPDGIALQDAPEHFFDQDKWRSVVDGSASRNAALDYFSSTTIGMLIYQMGLAAEQPTAEGARARRELEAYNTGQSLLADFRSRLQAGEILATGMSALAVDRISIPAVRWANLHLDFLKGIAEGQVTFTDVRLSLSPAVQISACSVWLEQRKAEGVTSKKQLKAEASEHFPDVTSRDFDAAYTAVFQTSRGRPRKHPSE